MELLAEAGADLDVVDEGENTPLHKSIEGAGLDAVVQILFRNKANMEAKDKRGNTPLMKAVMHNRPSIVEILLRVCMIFFFLFRFSFLTFFL